MKILIIGATGLTGSKLLERFSKSHNTVGTYFKNGEVSQTQKNLFHLDVTKHLTTEKAITDLNPELVIYCASNPHPDYCELNQLESKEVNYDGLINVASICSSLKKKIIFISTDQVFSGKKKEHFEDDSADPLNYFGKTKYLSETYIRENNPNHLIIRSSLIYGFAPKTESRGLVNEVIQRLSTNEIIELDTYRKFYPVLADDIVETIELLINTDETGTFHISTDKGYTKYEIGFKVAQYYGFNASLIKPIEQIDLPAKRGRNIYLNSDKVKKLGVELTSLENGLKVHKNQFGCSFRMIYSVRPDMLVANQNASEFRIEAGKAIAKHGSIPANIDCIIPIPESGLYSATGLSAESKIPIFFGIIRDYFTEKTLYSKTEESRHLALSKKLIVVKSVVENKNIILVDEAVLSGSTLRVIINSLKEAGANEIHVRIPSPIMGYACNNKILPKMSLLYSKIIRESLSKVEVEKIFAEYFNVTSIEFLSHEIFRSIAKQNKYFCTDCFLK